MAIRKLMMLLTAIGMMTVIFSCKDDEEKVKGCTNPAAANFNANANEDDGSCIYETDHYCVCHYQMQGVDQTITDTIHATADSAAAKCEENEDELQILDSNGECHLQ